jgi:hypothetical protein
MTHITGVTLSGHWGGDKFKAVLSLRCGASTPQHSSRSTMNSSTLSRSLRM